MNSGHATPRWILFYVGFLALLSLSTSLMGYLAPDRIFIGTGIAFDEIQPVTFFYATRNVGIFVLCLFGLITRDSKVILSVLLVRFVVDLLDLVFTIQFGIGGFNPVIATVVWLAVFLIPEGLGMYTLFKRDFAGK